MPDVKFKNFYTQKEINRLKKENLENYIKLRKRIYKKCNKINFISKSRNKRRLKIAKKIYLDKYGKELKNNDLDLDLLSCFSVNELAKYAPDNVKDPLNMGIKKSDSRKNTEVYLWKHGYDVGGYIGHGAQSVIWALKGSNKCIKVTCSSKKDSGFTKIEFNILKDLNAALDKRKTSSDQKETFIVKQADKRLNLNNPVAKNYGEKLSDKPSPSKRYLFEADSANGDIKQYVREKHDLDEIISMMKDIFKGIYALHQLGWSHNDLCPDNVLYLHQKIEKIKKFNDNIDKNKILEINNTDPMITYSLPMQTNGEKNTKIKFKISDFGACTPIKSRRRSPAGRGGYCCPGHKKATAPYEVERKDVYSGGCIVLHSLLQLKGPPKQSQLNYIAVKSPFDSYNHFNLERLYGPDNKNKVICILTLLNYFLQPNCHSRPDTKEALRLILQTFKKAN